MGFKPMTFLDKDEQAQPLSYSRWPKTHHGLFAEGDRDVGELLQDGLVVFHDHLLQHLDVLEGRQPELGDALRVLPLFLVLLLVAVQLDLMIKNDNFINQVKAIDFDLQP